MSGDGIIRVALAQINTTVGDLQGNRERVLCAWREATAAGASLCVFPELTLTGYPPEDLLLKPSFLDDSRGALEALAPAIDRGLALVGFADPGPAAPRNAAALIGGGAIRGIYHKCTLPNYGVFDEKRYFQAGRRCPVYEIGPLRLAVNICEDIWVEGGVPLLQAAAGGANLMVNLSASPYHARKGRVREELVTVLARRLGLPVLQTNLVGGQDELVFDGQSVAAAADGTVIGRAVQFAEQVLLIDVPLAAATRRDEASASGEGLILERIALAELAGPPEPPRTALPHPAIHPELGEEEEVYRALLLGLSDYVRKNGFRGVVIGLSGGIDSALTAVIAADALGPRAVVALSMPSEYSSHETRADARRTAANLGIEFHEIPIDGLFRRAREDLTPVFRGAPADVTEENLQARIRGMLLMAFSNKFGHLVLATGNKSEVAVGYCTLYGDMVGGFSVLKDVLKTQVYRLARWRNGRDPSPPIPETTIARVPSAELRPDQRDTDTLPPYEVLDPIVKALVEEDAAPRDLRAAGYDAEVIERVFRMIQGNEYKRRQAAPGIKITPRAFGRDRRYPLTNRYRPGLR
ncbi:MAG: NAD+ synthase [Candidatus Eisenbacteria bacterium]